MTDQADLSLAAEWTLDCQGKQDYDAEIVSLSTRYWPRGGGFSIRQDGEFKTNHRQDIKPSAVVAIYLVSGDPNDHRHEKIWSAKFEAETEAEVNALVEAWAREKFAKVVAIMRSLK